MEEAQEELRLTRETLTDKRAILAVGTVAARALMDAGICTFFINNNGEVEIALPGELECDGMPEEAAIRKLADSGYKDQQVIAYLQGRDARTKLRR